VSELTIRPAFPDDAEGLRRLAALDSSAVPAGGLLIGEMDGVIAAALSIHSGVAIADPFRPTAGLVELLAQRAQQLHRDRPRTKHGRARRALRRNGTPQPTPSVLLTSGNASTSDCVLDAGQAKTL